MSGETVRQIRRELLRKGVLYAWSKDMRRTFDAVAEIMPGKAQIVDYPYPELAPQCFYEPPIASIKVLATGSAND